MRTTISNFKSYRKNTSLVLGLTLVKFDKIVNSGNTVPPKRPVAATRNSKPNVSREERILGITGNLMKI